MRRSYSMIRVSDLTITRDTALRILKPLVASCQSGVSTSRSLWLFDCRGLASKLGSHYGLSLEIAVDLAVDVLEFYKGLDLEASEGFIESMVSSQAWYARLDSWSLSCFWLEIQNSQDIPSNLS